MVAFLELFNEAASHVVEYEGKPLYSTYSVTLPPRGRLSLAFLSSVPEPVQGLTIRASSGRLAIADEVRPAFVLWADTAPPVVEVTGRARRPVTVLIRNCWRDGAGGVMSSLGSAAMRVEGEGRDVVLRASDWTSPPSFEDLVVRVSLHA